MTRDGRQGVGDSRSTGDTGGPAPGHPVEGRGGRNTTPHEGKTAGTPTPESVSTKLERIAKLAREAPDMAFRTLAHHIDIDFLKEAHRRTRKGGAAGVDKQTAEDYARDLDSNLASLLDRFKSGTYRAPPVRRVHIPKGDGKTRPIGIPTFEDKVLQRAVAMILEAVYEQDFIGCSFGFRPGKSAHQALDTLWKGIMKVGGGWILDVDIKGFFDSLVPAHLRSILDLRVCDGVLRRTIDKWLKAGVQEDGALSHPDLGTPQGGVISPILSNIYLHEVLDKWLTKEVKPRLRGKAALLRYADDFVIICTEEADARRVLEVLPKRFERFGLTLHPEKTRLVPFKPPGPQGPGGNDGDGPGSFDLLGFTHFWARSRKGNWVVKRQTAKKRLSRALHSIMEWCRNHRHEPIAQQHQTLALKIRGHCQYYGITGNSSRLAAFREAVIGVWRKWLARRSQTAKGAWEWMNGLLKRFPLPQPIAVHSALRRMATA